MLYLLGTFAVIVAVGALFIRFTVIIMGRRVGKYLSETHGALEYIHTTGAAPPQWLEPFRKKHQQLQQNDPQYQASAERNARSARKICLKKLAKLQKYVYRSSLVQDEETRDILLKKLTDVREKWAEQDWYKILNP
jgi:hypothetical protein